MATATKTPTRQNGDATATSTETTAGYFKNLLEDPKWRKEPTKDILGKWELEHPGQEITPSVKTALAKARAKAKGIGARRKRVAAAQVARPAMPGAAAGVTTLVIPDVPESFPINHPAFTINRVEMKGEVVLKLELRKNLKP